MELEKRFKDLDMHFQRFNEVDSRLSEVTTTLCSLSDVVRQVTATQEAVSGLRHAHFYQKNQNSKTLCTAQCLF